MEIRFINKLSTITVLLISIILLTLTTCEKDDKVPTFTDQGNIGPEGGIVKTPDGASVIIPTGALTEVHSIAIKKNTSDNLGTSSEYWAYDLKPDGLSFKDSITIALPFNDKFLNTLDTLDKEAIRVFLVQDSSLCEIKAKIDFENNLAIIKTIHFSTYLVIFPSEWGAYFENRGDKSVTLTVPYYEQFGDWCFYYSLSMILKNEGYSYKGPYLASKCLERDPNKTGFYANLDDGLLSFMTVLGIYFNYKRFWFNKVNLFGYIIYCLDDNRPVELLIADAHHAVVVTGYDKFGFYIHDPNNPSPSQNHYSYKDISDNAIGDWFCNTLIIRSAGKDLKSDYTLNFHDYDITIKEDPNNYVTIGRLRINGLYMPSGHAIVATTTQADQFGYIIPGSFDGKDYIVLKPIFANAGNNAKPAIVQVKIDANEIPLIQRLIEIPPRNLNYQEDEPLISRLVNLNKGSHTVTVELRSEDNVILYDSWKFDLNIANEFLVVKPTAAFTATPRTLTTGQSVQFTDQSTNSPTSWSWNFGDGGTSTAKSPSHTYNTAGTYTVRLTATNSAGSDEETKSGYITVIYAIPTDGLAAYYTFDGNANDQSGNNNNGTVNGSVLMPDRLGNSNSAYYFDGLNDYIEVPNNQSLCLSTFTIIVYVNFDTTSTQKGILTKGYEFGNYTIQLTDEEWPYFVYACEAGNYSHYLKWGTMGNAQFHQLCFSFDKGKIVTYVNGKLELTLSDRPLPIIDNGPLIIGAGYNNIYEGISQFFKGIIDDVLIYNRVLSEDEIQNLYLNY